MKSQLSKVLDDWDSVLTQRMLDEDIVVKAIFQLECEFDALLKCIEPFYNVGKNLHSMWLSEDSVVNCSIVCGSAAENVSENVNLTVGDFVKLKERLDVILAMEDK